MAFLDSLDIANRACQHLGVERIASVTEDSRQNNEIANVYDKVLDTELMRNAWRFAIKKVALRALTATTMLLAPAVWNVLQLYLPGAVVADSNGDLWMSVLPENLGNTPGATLAWDQYFGPMTADAYVSTQDYFAGELVYQAGTYPGGYVVFMSLVNGNSEVPQTVDTWDTTVQYGQDDVVSYSGSQWRSLIAYNIGTTPANGPLDYAAGTTYSAAATVVGSDGYIYSSIAGSNVGNDPVTDAGVHWTNTGVPDAWASTPTIYPTSRQWVPLFAGLQTIFVIQPIGAGPQDQDVSRNLFRLPANYLGEVPQDPKGGVNSPLGGPSGSHYLDWEFDGDWIVSSEPNVIVFRFVAAITNVQKMTAMFCEGFAARIALETCQVLTQSSGKFQEVGASYKLAISEARLKNGIEEGPTEPPEDDFLTVRA